MFVESAFITREFKEEQIPILENITCLTVVNTGTTIVTVNGIVVVPKQIQVIIPPDGTYSRVQLEQVYQSPPPTFLEDNVLIETQAKGVITTKAYPQNKILLIYKKLI